MSVPVSPAEHGESVESAASRAVASAVGGKSALAPRKAERALSFGFVGTYPPTKCGIATFTASLARGIAPSGSLDRIGIVSSVDEPDLARQPAEVVAELVRGSAPSREFAAAELNAYDVVVIQHEFGIYGGPDGDEILDLVSRLDVPVIVVLHTALARPSARQQAIVEQLAREAEDVVAQTGAARTRLLEAHEIDPGRVRVIPHGAPANLAAEGWPRDAGRRPMILTMGLIGPSKGIEFGIEALTRLRDLDPAPRYLILGETHPRIVAASGDSYRKSLVARVHELALDDVVEFDNRYHDTVSLLARIREADVVLLPYLSRDQTVSGVLVEAIASGKPVVATGFPHALELLGEGSGIVVPHEDPDAIAAALRSILTDERTAARLAAVARKQAPALFWENVGRSYRRLALAVAGDRQLR